jgi:serine/threonine protein kinase
MCRGLAFLHESNGLKSSVAHRDFKSRNVLLKSNFTACIADFGLALALNENPGDVHSQVGTRRYMSPEVLDGSINFTVEHFLKIDVYACALVLWELLSRCVTSEDLPGEYRMPFEAEVGLHPTLEDMQDIVINRKMRPELKDSWYKNEDLSVICLTIEECWDHDPEARLSAECIELRFSLLYNSLPESKVSISTSSQMTSSSSGTDAKEEDSLVV